MDAWMRTFKEIAPYLTQPLVLVGFALMLSFGFYRRLIDRGIIPPLPKREASGFAHTLLRHSFITGFATILLGFSLTFYQQSSTNKEKEREREIEDASVLELEEILKKRAAKVEEWFLEQEQKVEPSVSNDEYRVAIEKFRHLHQQHLDALKTEQFVLAHEILIDIHDLLHEYDQTSYHRAAEYGYVYPGTFDDKKLYDAFKLIDESIRSSVMKSLFVGLTSSESAIMQATADMSISFSNQSEALMLATYEGDLGMVKAYLDAGYYVDVRLILSLTEMKGLDCTPLMLAAFTGEKEILKELISRGADINAVNMNGEKPIDIARKKGNIEIVKLLDAI